MKMGQRIFSAVLCAAVIMAPVASADVQDGSQASTIVSEYVANDMFKNFEDESVPASTVPASVEGLAVSAVSAMLMEKTTGKVLYEKNADEARPIASITKVMTMLLVMEAVEMGKISLDDVVTTSEHAAAMGGSQIWLEPGETMTVNELLKAAAVGSANDASVAMGEFVAGSEEAFVAMMNTRAAQLGMTSTHFNNSCGLDEDGHVSSARDIALMSRELLNHDLIKEYSQIWIDYLRGGSTQLVNTNKLVRFYPGTTGLKTGTTNKAGHCVSASAQRDGMELVAVVLAGKDSNSRFSDAKKLLDFGFANWSITTVDLDSLILDDVRVQRGTADRVEVVCGGSPDVLVPKGRKEDMLCKVTLPADVLAPVEKGQLLGKVTLTLDDAVVGELELTAATTIPRVTFWLALRMLLSSCAIL